MSCDVRVDGNDPIDLDEFLAQNTEDGVCLLAPEDVAWIRALAPGQAVYILGGAQPEVEVRRLNRCAHCEAEIDAGTVCSRRSCELAEMADREEMPGVEG